MTLFQKMYIYTFIVVGGIFTGLNSIFANESDIGKETFILDTGKFTPGGNRITGGGNTAAVDDANFALGFIIQQLMLFIGGFALLVMVIGAGYMIIHRGDDASLSKGKEIFTAGIIGLSVALLSYYMVSILRYIIYSI